MLNLCLICLYVSLKVCLIVMGPLKGRWNQGATLFSLFHLSKLLKDISIKILSGFFLYLFLIQTAVIPLESGCPLLDVDGGQAVFLFLLGVLTGFVCGVSLFVLWEVMARLVLVLLISSSVTNLWICVGLYLIFIIYCVVEVWVLIIG